MGTANLVWKVLVGAALCIIVGSTAISYIETLYMKAQLKRAEKRVEKKLEEVDKAIKELKDSK